MPDLLKIGPTIDGDLLGPFHDARKAELNTRIEAGEITLEEADAILESRNDWWPGHV